MIVSGYTTDLYCDGDGPHPYNWFPQTFTGETKGQCLRQARKRGWLASEERQLCPLCTGRMPAVIAESVIILMKRCVAANPTASVEARGEVALDMVREQQREYGLINGLDDMAKLEETVLHKSMAIVLRAINAPANA
jgi:hypothetical protein